MNIKIGGSIEQFKKWFLTEQAKIKARAADLEAKLSKQNLSQLSRETRAHLNNQIDALPPHPSHIGAVRSKLEEALTQWRSDRNAPNNLVVLTSPVEPIEAILKAILAEQAKTIPQVTSLTRPVRSPNELSSKTKLSEKLKLSQPSQFQVLVAIPNLSWCFLRCVEGLEEIEYLQDLIINERDRFWFIGCNNWTWKYLDCIYNLNSYCQQTFSLPTLRDIELKEWLLPISETIEFDFAEERDSPTDKSELNGDNEDNWTSKSERRYYSHLANISLGLSSIAARLWVESLWVLESEAESINSDIASKSFILQKATLPELPTLSKEDRYLLYSLNLHGHMTLSELALSLAERESIVQRQVEILRRSGIIEVKQDRIQLNPTYYPKIRTNLDNNRFLIEGV